MPFVSLTRIHLRPFRHLPAFAVWAVRTNRQVARSDGFLGGRLFNEAPLGFWTVTAWDDRAAMRAFRGGGAHGAVMPRLRTWCDEASVLHWEQDGPGLPDSEETLRRMVADGRLSRVDHPSPAHGAREIPATGTLRPGPTIAPRGD